MIQVKILTPTKVYNEGEFESLVADSVEGKLGILKDHAPLMAILSEGQLVLKKKDGLDGGREYFVGGGFLEVNKNHVFILTGEIKEI